MIDSAETVSNPSPPAPLPLSGARGADSEDAALSRVIYVRVTSDELALLKSNATASKLSLQRHARITLGLKDRGGYRNRKERLNGKATINAEAQTEATGTAIAKRDSESTL